MTRSAPDFVAPAFHWMPEYRRTLGDEVADLAALAGFPPDPEQRFLLDMAFALDARGKSAVRDVAVVAPRQNLKTGFFKQAALGYLFITEQRLITWSAHEFSTAQESFRDMAQLVEETPDLAREIKQIHYGNGDESIELTRDRRVKFKARTKSGGRGLSGDKVFLDEAMFLRPAHMGSIIPTLRARPDPQLLFGGSAGDTEANEWRAVRDSGRGGHDPSLGYAEWCDTEEPSCEMPGCSHAPGTPGCSLDDRRRWWSCNTALGRRITERTLIADRRRLPADEFARETLGWWEEPVSATGGLDVEAWLTLADPNAGRQGAAPTFGVATAPDRSWSAIGVAWRRPDGAAQVMLAAYQRGAEWVPDRAAELRATWAGQVLTDKASAGLVPDAEVLSPTDRAVADNALADAIAARTVRHGNEPALNVAVRAATWRPSGESRVLDRRGSADVSPVVAVGLALHGMTTEPTSGGWVMAL